MRAYEFINEGVKSGLAGAAIGAALTRSPAGAITGYQVGSDVGDALSDNDLEEKTDPKLCRSPKRLGRSDYSSCVSQGLRAHQSKGRGHTDGKGNYIKGKKIKGSKYGGPLPDHDSKP